MRTQRKGISTAQNKQGEKMKYTTSPFLIALCVLPAHCMETFKPKQNIEDPRIIMTITRDQPEFIAICNTIYLAGVSTHKEVLEKAFRLSTAFLKNTHLAPDEVTDISGRRAAFFNKLKLHYDNDAHKTNSALHNLALEFVIAAPERNLSQNSLLELEIKQKEAALEANEQRKKLLKIRMEAIKQVAQSLDEKEFALNDELSKLTRDRRHLAEELILAMQGQEIIESAIFIIDYLKKENEQAAGVCHKSKEYQNAIHVVHKLMTPQAVEQSEARITTAIATAQPTVPESENKTTSEMPSSNPPSPRPTAPEIRGFWGWLYKK